MAYSFNYGGIEFVEQEFPRASELDWIQEKPEKALVDAVVFRPVDQELSEEAINTIRHFRYYCGTKNGQVLLSDTVIAKVNTGTVKAMIEDALHQADTVTGSMPDFTPYDMDDGCGILHMCNVYVAAFRRWGLSESASMSLYPVLAVRQECLDACEACRIVAVVYNNREDFERVSQREGE